MVIWLAFSRVWVWSPFINNSSKKLFVLVIWNTLCYQSWSTALPFTKLTSVDLASSKFESSWSRKETKFSFLSSSVDHSLFALQIISHFCPLSVACNILWNCILVVNAHTGRVGTRRSNTSTPFWMQAAKCRELNFNS